MEMYWSDLLYEITGGKPTEIDRLMRFDIFEFFAYVKNYENKLKDGKRS